MTARRHCSAGVAPPLRRPRSRVDGVDLDGRARRDVRPARPERRRQDDDDPDRSTRCCRSRQGRIEVLGFDVRRAQMAVRRRLGYVPQQLSIEAALTGRENVSWFARLFDVPRAERARARRRRARDDGPHRRRRPARRHLLGRHGPPARARAGARQPAGAARARRADGRASTRSRATASGSASRSCASRPGMTVLLTTHYMEEADALCDRVALMHLGRIAADRPAGRARSSRSGRTRRSRTSSATTPGNELDARTTAKRSAALRSAARAGPQAVSADVAALAEPRSGGSSRAASATFCLVELQKLRHDRTELFTRAVQPVLWLVIFGETFNRLHAIPTGHVPVPRLPRARASSPSRACSSRSSTASRSSGSATPACSRSCS